jgi:Domain of unknown function (DUF4157)
MNVFTATPKTPASLQKPVIFPKTDAFANAHNPNILFRSANCACGGNCPACQKKSSDMKISQPSDAAEIEADQIADKVMRTPAGETNTAESSKKTSGAIHRKCNTCKVEEEMIQRKPLPSGSSVPSGSPAHVSEALSSGGRPLDRETRNFFEPRLGYDLGNIRIHTGRTAEQSAKAIDAKAYTLGSNIVFGSGEYRPDSVTGQHLIAHELAHTTQAGRTGANRIIHRRGAVMARPPAPVMPNYWSMQGYSGSAADQAYLNRLGAGNAVVAASGSSGRAVDPREVCTDQGRDTNWGACAALRESQANYRVRQRVRVEAAEKPQIMLTSGGSASDAFIREGKQKTETYYDRPPLTYTPRFFHIIDAMEYDFDLSTSHAGDLVLYMLYFPELQHAKLEGSTKADVSFLTKTAIVRVTFDPDPQSVPERMKALQQILNRRMVRIRARVRKMQEERLLAEAETATLTHKGKQRLEGACDSKTIKRKGGHDRHDTYAKHVGKEKGYGNVNRELQYTTPEGVSYSFDVYNPANMSHVWEVKTMHDWAGPDKIAIAPRIVRDKGTKLPNMSERIASLESQRLKGIYVAARCGLVFRYSFDNCEAYRGFKAQWALPPLEYIPYPGEKKEVCND